MSASKPNITGWPSAPTVGLQCRTKSEMPPPPPPRGEWQQLKNVSLSSWLIKLVQARNSVRCPRRKLLLTENHCHSRLPLPREQMKGTSVLQIIPIEILVKVSSRKWGRSDGMGEGLSRIELGFISLDSQHDVDPV